MAATSTIPAVVATPREGKFNKNAARRVRAGGKIPAVVYGAGQESVAVSVDPRTITKILHSDSGHNTIFDLDVSGSATVKAMIVDWQNEPLKGALLHIDLKRIAMDKAMRVSVPVQLVGVPVGVKAQGGILEHVLREVEIECLPSDIPSHLDVDVSALEINQLGPRLRPAALRLDQVPHRRRLDRSPCRRDPRRGCGARSSGRNRDAGRTRSCQEGQGRDRSRTGTSQGGCEGRRQGGEGKK